MDYYYKYRQKKIILYKEAHNQNGTLVTIFSGQHSSVGNLVYYLYPCSKSNSDGHDSIVIRKGERDKLAYFQILSEAKDVLVLQRCLFF